MKKRLLSALLALVMVLTMLPATVFATPGGGDSGSGSSDTTTKTAAKVEVNVTIPTTGVTWATGDKITISTPSTVSNDKSFSAVLTATVDSSNSTVTWAVSQTDADKTNYTAKYADGKLTLTAVTEGETNLQATDFGTLEVKATDSSNTDKKDSSNNDLTITASIPTTGGITNGTTTTTPADSPSGDDEKDDDKGGATNPDKIVNPNDGVTPTYTAGPAQKDMSVTYQAKSNAGNANNKVGPIVGAPGYFVTVKEDGWTRYYKVTTGLIVGNKFLNSSSYNAATSTSNIIVIGGSCSVTADSKATSLTIEVYGDGAGLTVYGGSALTTLTIKDSKYADELNLGVRSKKNEVTLSNSWATGKPATLNLENVDVKSTISMSGNYTHKVTLTNADVSGITLDGTDLAGKKNDAAQTITVNSETSNKVRGSSVGAISVEGNGSSVQLYDATVTSVKLDGTGTKLTVGGSSSVGDVELTDHLTGKASKTKLSDVTVKGAVTGKITTKNAEAGTVKVDVQAGGSVTGDIDLTGSASDNTLSADVDVTAATVGGTIKVEGGTVDVGSQATVTGLEMSGATTFKVNGSKNTVTGLKVTGSQVNMTIPADSTNQFGVASGGLTDYKKGNILGGMWDTAVPAAALSSTIDYQLAKDSGTYKYGYYTEAQLASALTDQGTSDKSVLTCTKVGLNDTEYTLVFKNGKDKWGEMKVHGGVQIKLPNVVNNVTVTRWTDLWRSYAAGASYSTPAQKDLPTGTTEWELNAGGGVTNGDISKFTGVSVKGDLGSKWETTFGEKIGTVRGTLNGSVITLTGAVPRGTSTMTLALSTDAVKAVKDSDGKDTNVNEPVVLNVRVTYNSATKNLVFANVATDLGYGATLETENSTDILRLSNGAKYTLNGSGLKEIASQIHVATKGNNYLIEASANGVSSLKTPAARNAVVALINGGVTTKFDWSGSPAMEAAVNAALANITDKDVETWIKAAQKAAWDKLSSGAYDQATDGVATGYDTAYLVPYLQVNLTNYVAGGTATATLVPSWRVEVRQSTPGGKYSTIFYDANDPSKPANAYIAKAGTSLGQLTGEFGKVKFETNNFFKDTKFYMHQDGTYAYQYDTTDGYVITHAGTGSNGLGTMVISTDVPLVQRLDKKEGGTVQAYYDTLQAAVDDAKDGQHINVDQNYKGSTSINVTGDARKFTIQANGNNVVIANASGGLVDWNNTGSEYTVQLSRNAAAVVDGTSVPIAVARVANGTATVNVSSAKVGGTVSVNCTPAAGYRTSAVTVSAHMTKNNTNVSVSTTRVSDNVYNFKVPEGADSITVTPVFVVGTAAAIPFTDVATNHWAYDSVKYVYENGLMNGVNTSGTQFGGNQNLTRAMVVTILYRAAGSPAVGSYSNFSDVAGNTWYSQAVAWANQNNIVTGYTNGTFQPTWDITRQELATILYRYNTSYKGRATTGSTTLANFPDQGKVSDWATAGMQWAVGNSIVNGITNGSSTTLTPGGNATRYQAATMLMRYGQGFGL